MIRKNEVYAGLGKYNPHVFYMHLNVGPINDDSIYIKLYEHVNKIREKPIIYIFDVFCEVGEKEVIAKKYNLICVTREYEMIEPSQDDIYLTIKEILMYKKFNDNILYSLESKFFFNSEDPELRELSLTLLRSLGKMSEYKTVYV